MLALQSLLLLQSDLSYNLQYADEIIHWSDGHKLFTENADLYSIQIGALAAAGRGL